MKLNSIRNALIKLVFEKDRKWFHIGVEYREIRNPNSESDPELNESGSLPLITCSRTAHTGDKKTPQLRPFRKPNSDEIPGSAIFVLGITRRLISGQ